MGHVDDIDTMDNTYWHVDDIDTMDDTDTVDNADSDTVNDVDTNDDTDPVDDNDQKNWWCRYCWWHC